MYQFHNVDILFVLLSMSIINGITHYFVDDNVKLYSYIGNQEFEKAYRDSPPSRANIRATELKLLKRISILPYL